MTIFALVGQGSAFASTKPAEAVKSPASATMLAPLPGQPGQFRKVLKFQTSGLGQQAADTAINCAFTLSDSLSRTGSGPLFPLAFRAVLACPVAVGMSGTSALFDASSNLEAIGSQFATVSIAGVSNGSASVAIGSTQVLLFSFKIQLPAGIAPFAATQGCTGDGVSSPFSCTFGGSFVAQ
jgi:hypothetical protein